MRSRSVLVVALATVLLIGVTVPAPAKDIGDALTAFGIGYAVSVFGGQINDFINGLLSQKGLEWEGTTKVVPILSIGSGAKVGAAQVAGPPELVKGVKAVAQVEITAGDFKGTAMIPVGSTDVKKGLNRIEGVGLSAIVDFKL